jgi:penicillin-binding protein-related factor A (putative recombinase)
MINRYRRFQELKRKAKVYLTGRGDDIEQLINAVNEIYYMREDEVPDYSWKNVQSIIDVSTKHKQVEQEGAFKASISKMNFVERKALRRAIESL